MKTVRLFLLLAVCIFSLNLFADNPPSINKVLNINAKFITPVYYQVYKEGETIKVKVDVTSFTPIQSMKLYLNGTVIGVDKTAPYEWDSNNTPGLRNLKPGGYELKCRVRDINRKDQIIRVKFKVVRASCIITSSYTYPKTRQLLFAGDYLYVRVDPKKNQDIAQMAFYFDGKLIRIDTTYPFEWGRKGSHRLDPKMGKLRYGRHQLKCIITDKCGESRTINRTIFAERKPRGGFPRK